MDSEYKSPEHRREVWMREVRYRQRNIVYPETAMNRARFWRNLTSRKYPFTRGQKLCFVILLTFLVPSFPSLLAMVIVPLRGGSPVWNLLESLLMGTFILDFYAHRPSRALSAVFADTPPISELPLSSTINMARQAATRLPRS